MAETSELVQLHLISPSHIEPLPDKSNFGRFDKILRSVGSPRTVYVRPRMITVVSGTKYSTRTGLPVSLVGLHGKDELLVVGPPWALLKLAAGGAPKVQPQEDARARYREAIRTVVEEAFWICRVKSLINIVNGTASGPGSLTQVEGVLPVDVGTYLASNPLWKQMENDVALHEHSAEFLQFAATDLLQGMLRCSIEVIRQYFSQNDVDEFAITSSSECVEKFQNLSAELEEYDDVHPVWWGEWEGKEEQKRLISVPDLITKSGRNITGYPTKEDSCCSPIPRRYSMHEKWVATLERYREQFKT